MLPDDPRHGKYAGAVQHWMDGEQPCATCQIAESRYRKNRLLKALRGEPATVNATGTVRRIKALQALGYSRNIIAADSGVSLYTIHSIFCHQSTRVLSDTARRICATYDRLSMVIPQGHYSNRNRNMAAQKGWLPPLAWDDDKIDDPGYYPKAINARGTIRKNVDPVVVDRILAGDMHLQATPAERREVVRRWEGSQYELAHLTGWNITRYTAASIIDEKDIAS